MKLDEFHYHEALDRTTVVRDLLELSVGEHPVTRKHKSLLAKIELAQDALHAVVQEIVRLDELREKSVCKSRKS